MHDTARYIAKLKPWYYFFACPPFIFFAFFNYRWFQSSGAFGLTLFVCGIVAYRYRVRHETKTYTPPPPNNPFIVLGHFLMQVVFFFCLVLLMQGVQSLIAYGLPGGLLLATLCMLVAYTLQNSLFRVYYTRGANDLRTAYYIILCSIFLIGGVGLLSMTLYHKNTHIENIGLLAGFISACVLGIGGYFFMKAERREEKARVLYDRIVN